MNSKFAIQKSFWSMFSKKLNRTENTWQVLDRVSARSKKKEECEREELFQSFCNSAAAFLF